MSKSAKKCNDVCDSESKVGRPKKCQNSGSSTPSDRRAIENAKVLLGLDRDHEPTNYLSNSNNTVPDIGQKKKCGTGNPQTGLQKGTNKSISSAKFNSSDQKGELSWDISTQPTSPMSDFNHGVGREKPGESQRELERKYEAARAMSELAAGVFLSQSSGATTSEPPPQAPPTSRPPLTPSPTTATTVTESRKRGIPNLGPGHSPPISTPASSVQKDLKLSEIISTCSGPLHTDTTHTVLVSDEISSETKGRKGFDCHPTIMSTSVTSQDGITSQERTLRGNIKERIEEETVVDTLPLAIVLGMGHNETKPEITRVGPMQPKLQCIETDKIRSGQIPDLPAPLPYQVPIYHSSSSTQLYHHKTSAWRGTDAAGSVRVSLYGGNSPSMPLQAQYHNHSPVVISADQRSPTQAMYSIADSGRRVISGMHPDGKRGMGSFVNPVQNTQGTLVNTQRHEPSVKQEYPSSIDVVLRTGQMIKTSSSDLPSRGGSESEVAVVAENLCIRDVLSPTITNNNKEAPKSLPLKKRKYVTADEDQDGASPVDVPKQMRHNITNCVSSQGQLTNTPLQQAMYSTSQYVLVEKDMRIISPHESKPLVAYERLDFSEHKTPVEHMVKASPTTVPLDFSVSGRTKVLNQENNIGNQNMSNLSQIVNKLSAQHQRTFGSKEFDDQLKKMALASFTSSPPNRKRVLVNIKQPLDLTNKPNLQSSFDTQSHRKRRVQQQYKQHGELPSESLTEFKLEKEIQRKSCREDFRREANEGTACGGAGGERESAYTSSVMYNESFDGAGAAEPKEEDATSAEPLPINPQDNLRMLRELRLAVIPDEDGDLPLHIAVVQGKEKTVHKVIRMMSKQSVKLDYCNKLRQTPLHLAVITKQPNIVQILLSNGASPDVIDREGNSSVHLAVLHTSVVCLKDLIKYSKKGKINLNCKNYEGFAPLHLAVQLKDTEAMHILLEAGAIIDITDGKSGRTPLHHAAESRQLRVVEMLLEHHSRVNIQSFAGNTALHTASERNYKEIMTLLVRYGADTTIKNGNHETYNSVVKDTKAAIIRETSTTQGVDVDKASLPIPRKATVKRGRMPQVRLQIKLTDGSLPSPTADQAASSPHIILPTSVAVISSPRILSQSKSGIMSSPKILQSGESPKSLFPTTTTPVTSPRIMQARKSPALNEDKPTLESYQTGSKLLTANVNRVHIVNGKAIRMDLSKGNPSPDKISWSQNQKVTCAEKAINIQEGKTDKIKNLTDSIYQTLLLKPHHQVKTEAMTSSNHPTAVSLGYTGGNYNDQTQMVQSSTTQTNSMSNCVAVGRIPVITAAVSSVQTAEIEMKVEDCSVIKQCGSPAPISSLTTMVNHLNPDQHRIRVKHTVSLPETHPGSQPRKVKVTRTVSPPKRYSDGSMPKDESERKTKSLDAAVKKHDSSVAEKGKESSVHFHEVKIEEEKNNTGVIINIVRPCGNVIQQTIRGSLQDENSDMMKAEPADFNYRNSAGSERDYMDSAGEELKMSKCSLKLEEESSAKVSAYSEKIIPKCEMQTVSAMKPDDTSVRPDSQTEGQAPASNAGKRKIDESPCKEPKEHEMENTKNVNEQPIPSLNESKSSSVNLRPTIKESEKTEEKSNPNLSQASKQKFVGTVICQTNHVSFHTPESLGSASPPTPISPDLFRPLVICEREEVKANVRKKRKADDNGMELYMPSETKNELSSSVKRTKVSDMDSHLRVDDCRSSASNACTPLSSNFESKVDSTENDNVEDIMDKTKEKDVSIVKNENSEEKDNLCNAGIIETKSVLEGKTVENTS